MRLALMQPYFFPYLGHFHLIQNVDKWIVFDTAQYINRGWVNRNRILHPQHGWRYITVPVRKHSQKSIIKDIQVIADSGWKESVFGSLSLYRKRAPYYLQALTLVEDCLSKDENFIARLNVFILEKVCQHLGIPFNFYFLSDMDFESKGINAPGDWAIEISKAMGASEYINPPGGAGLYDQEQFRDVGLKLTIQKEV